MGNQVNNKFTWVIKNFSPSKRICSDIFVIGGCKWRLVTVPGCKDYLDLYLSVADYISLPPGWRRHAQCIITVVNQKSEKTPNEMWFNLSTPRWISETTLALTKRHNKDGGFVVNDEVKIVVEVEVLKVIGNLDVSEESEPATQPLKNMKLADRSAVSSDLYKETSSVNESMNVNGFQLLPSQVDLVRRIFEKHPDMALKFRPKNPLLKTAYMNVLVSLIETMCQSPQKISKDDLSDAYGSLGSMRDAGFKLDWLEKKLNEVSEKKEKVEAYETRMQEIEEELKDLKAKVLAARAPLTLDDVF